MKKLLVICCIVLMSAPVVMAQEQTQVPSSQYGFEMGNYEFSIQGSGSSDDDVDNTVFSIEANLGYFLTQQIEVGVRQGIGYQDRDNGDDIWNGSTRVFADYNFNWGKLAPFFGLNFGYLYGESVNNSWIGGPEIGVKYFLKPEVFIQALIEYNATFEDAGNAEDAFEDGRFVYAVGLGIVF